VFACFSGGFPGIPNPRGKSIIDADSVTDALPFQDPRLVDLAELRALTLTTDDEFQKCCATGSRITRESLTWVLPRV
jgi:hypothetical protein